MTYKPYAIVISVALLFQNPFFIHFHLKTGFVRNFDNPFNKQKKNAIRKLNLNINVYKKNV